jgi:signal transduction histidine kinase/CheY-like chemotaxis protein
MEAKARNFRLSLEAKVLLPFLVFLGLIPGFGVVLAVNAGLRPVYEQYRTPIAITLAGFLVSSGFVWLCVRRLTRMLRQLRTMAETVGRGDFSRRITHYSNDECGDLAEAFNWMTGDLQRSRLVLEKAAESLADTRERLVQTEKLSTVGQFVAGVAHELNNPLAVVIGFSELLLGKKPEEKFRSQLEIIGKSAQRCHRIVANLLSFSRVHRPERKAIRLNGTVDEVVELMAYNLRTSNIEVIKDLQPVLPPIVADQHQLQQVFVNIMGNARQAVEGFRPDGRIIVRTRASSGVVRVEIEDNGPGISPENKRRIFEPFFTTKPVGKGTGLGLSLVCDIIREHSGTISLASELGHGATFIIELPICADEVPASPAAVRAQFRRIRPAGSSGKAILVIDDEEWMRTLAREVLGDIGHAVDLAADGESALAAIERRNYDVIVCDWKMPKMSGVQLFERLQETRPQLLERVLFMSGEFIEPSFQEFLVRHERTCLPKPFPIEEFRDAVEKIMTVASSSAGRP